MNIEALVKEGKFTFARWCSGCNAEEAVDQIEVEIGDKWQAIDVGPECLTRLKEGGRI